MVIKSLFKIEAHEEGRNHGQIRNPLWCFASQAGQEV